MTGPRVAPGTCVAGLALITSTGGLGFGVRGSFGSETPSPHPAPETRKAFGWRSKRLVGGAGQVGTVSLLARHRAMPRFCSVTRRRWSRCGDPIAFSHRVDGEGEVLEFVVQRECSLSLIEH